eukprot:403336524
MRGPSAMTSHQLNNKNMIHMNQHQQKYAKDPDQISSGNVSDEEYDKRVPTDKLFSNKAKTNKMLNANQSSPNLNKDGADMIKYNTSPSTQTNNYKNNLQSNSSKIALGSPNNAMDVFQNASISKFQTSGNIYNQSNNKQQKPPISQSQQNQINRHQKTQSQIYNFNKFNENASAQSQRYQTNQTMSQQTSPTRFITNSVLNKNADQNYRSPTSLSYLGQNQKLQDDSRVISMTQRELQNKSQLTNKSNQSYLNSQNFNTKSQRNLGDFNQINDVVTEIDERQNNKHVKAPSFQFAYQQFAQRLIKQGMQGQTSFHTNVLLPDKSLKSFKQTQRSYQPSPDRKQLGVGQTTQNYEIQQSQIHERLYKEHQAKNQLKEKMHMPNWREEQELQKCTFQPNNQQMQRQRSTQDFIQDQERHELERRLRLEQKQREILEQEENELRDAALKLKSSRSPQGRFNSNVTNNTQIDQFKSPRDHSLSKSTHKNHQSVAEFHFKPQINKKSEKMVQKNQNEWHGALNHLVEDAQKRLKRIQETKQEMRQKISPRETPRVIEKSTQMILSKFQNEFTNACKECRDGAQTQEEQNNDMISFDMYQRVMQQLGFSYQTNDNIQSQMIQLNSQQQPVGQNQIINKNDNGFELRNGIFFISSENRKAHQNMFHKFYELNHSRQIFIKQERREKSVKRTLDQSSVLNHSVFKPQLDKKSLRIVQEKIGNKSNNDYLRDLSKTREAFQSKVDQMKQITIEEELNKCTQRDRSNEDVEFEQNKDKCTFKPQINEEKKNLYKRPQTTQLNHSAIVFLFFMKFNPYNLGAKLQHETVISSEQTVGKIDYTEDGNSQNYYQSQQNHNNLGSMGVEDMQHDNSQNFIKSSGHMRKHIDLEEVDSDDQNSEDNVKIPIICLDVKISQENTEQLLIYEGDDIEEVSKQFAKLYNISESKRLKLIKIIFKQSQILQSNQQQQQQQQSYKGNQK